MRMTTATRNVLGGTATRNTVVCGQQRIVGVDCQCTTTVCCSLSRRSSTAACTSRQQETPLVSTSWGHAHRDRSLPWQQQQQPQQQDVLCRQLQL